MSILRRNSAEVVQRGCKYCVIGRFTNGKGLALLLIKSQNLQLSLVPALLTDEGHKADVAQRLFVE